MLSGLAMYSVYKMCDPLSNNDVSTSDQVSAHTPVLAKTSCLMSLEMPITMMKNNHSAASIPGYGYSGCLSWHPWLVCGSCVQWNS